MKSLEKSLNGLLPTAILAGVFLTACSASSDHQTWAEFQGSCKDIKAEVSANGQSATVIIPAGCNYVNSTF